MDLKVWGRVDGKRNVSPPCNGERYPSLEAEDLERLVRSRACLTKWKDGRLEALRVRLKALKAVIDLEG
jgi:hypothetical protein